MVELTFSFLSKTDHSFDKSIRRVESILIHLHSHRCCVSHLRPVGLNVLGPVKSCEVINHSIKTGFVSGDVIGGVSRAERRIFLMF